MALSHFVRYSERVFFCLKLGHILMNNFSDYIVFIDESGDHGMGKIDQGYPIFVLTCCVFNKSHYCNMVLPRFNDFKMKYWGHNNIILHESDIRRPKKTEYYFLNDENSYTEFMTDLSNVIKETEFFHITTIVDKNKLSKRQNHSNIYEFALLFCMERLHQQLEYSQKKKIVDVIIESRGKKEDKEIELEFRRILDGQQKTFASSTAFNSVPYRFHVKRKECNIIGLQIADLIARPIGNNYGSRLF